MHKYTLEEVNKEGIVITMFVISLFFAPLLNFITKIFDTFEKHVIVNFILNTVCSFLFIFFLIYKKLFCECLWKNKYVLKFFKIIDLNGEWQIEGTSKNNYKKEEQKWQGILKIEQTFNDIAINFKTKESSSKSKSNTAAITRKSKNEYILKYTYTNNPEMSAADDMKTHEGYCEVTFDLKGAGEAWYFTNSRDRGTYGTMKLKKVGN